MEKIERFVTLLSGGNENENKLRQGSTDDTIWTPEGWWPAGGLGWISRNSKIFHFPGIGEFVKIRTFTLVISEMISLQKDNSDSKIKILEFLGIQPTADGSSGEPWNRNKEDFDIITSVLLNLGLFGEKKESENVLELFKRLGKFGKSALAFIILNFISPRLWKELHFD